MRLFRKGRSAYKLNCWTHTVYIGRFSVNPWKGRWQLQCIDVFLLENTGPISNPPHIECFYLSAQPRRPMLSSHDTLEDRHPEKSSVKEEVALLLMGSRCWKIFKDVGHKSRFGRQLRPLTEPIVDSVFFLVSLEGLAPRGAKAGWRNRTRTFIEGRGQTVVSTLEKAGIVSINNSRKTAAYMHR